MLVDETDAFFAGFRCDEHDDAKVVAVGNGFVFLLIIAEREVGNDDAVDADGCTLLAERLETELHDRVEVAHEDEGNVNVRADVLQLREEFTERHSACQRLDGGILDDGAVGERVGEGNTDFNHVDAVGCQHADDVCRAVGRGMSGAEIDGENIPLLGGKEVVDAVHIAVELMFVKVVKKVAQQGNVLDAGTAFKLGIEVDAGELRMTDVA